ncbi:HAD family hydrolase [Saccharicrinis fermentans]|uniref:Phosphatase YbjI n=1 Tax=Saccharicrinis fermentans DSM 9555 = JCM 21142 TaxID=869213 RepID=W7Y322_9BACT|nr:HAD family hydrolase [Saccharicrinis fermentans]GAF02397.1 phosphatase YbjI [Saccharicrinis fermentans DSM 9555 = JCM 21142]
MVQIKLIVADMDGTLLNSNHELSPKFEATYKQLRRLGIRFVVASGRPYYTLLPQFEHMEHDMILIGDNGAYIGTRPEPVVMKAFAHDEVAEIAALGRSLEDVYLVICTQDRPYTESDDPYFIAEAKRYYPTLKVVNNTDELEEKVLKIAAFDAKTWQLNSGKAWDVFQDKYVVAKSSNVWIDLMPLGINKGAAVKYLQEQLGISKEETMAFGDFHNDIEMLQMAHHSYAMENAHDDVQQVARFKAPSNDRDGVIKVIEEIVLKKI